MKNLNLLLLVLCMSLFLSCSNSEEPKAVEPATTEETPVPPAESASALEGLPVNTMMRAKYVSAAVYAAATDYVFELDDGQQITIRVSEEEDVEKPEVPPILLESGEELEGPPGANPDLIGKYLTIEQDQDGNYIRVIYSQGKRKEAEE